jgi:NAD(P)-dependent dehydrogenase (short-subunit alcohol dehydrogenase family)
MTSQQNSIVTGGGSGMGRAICLRFAAHGRVGVLDRDAEGAQKTVTMIEAAGGEAIALEADVTRSASMDAAFERFEAEGGPAEMVVACAGVERIGTVVDEPEEDWDFVMDVNAKGVYLTARAAFRGFVERRSGSFVVISSDAGVIGSSRYGIYTASKHAVVGLVRCLALDFGPLGIRSNVVCPGPIDTPMSDQFADHYVNYGGKSSHAYWVSRVPAGRYGKAEEVARAVEFLSTPAASYINGSVYTVDGGSNGGTYSRPTQP